MNKSGSSWSARWAGCGLRVAIAGMRGLLIAGAEATQKERVRGSDWSSSTVDQNVDSMGDSNICVACHNTDEGNSRYKKKGDRGLFSVKCAVLAVPSESEGNEKHSTAHSHVLAKWKSPDFFVKSNQYLIEASCPHCSAHVGKCVDLASISNFDSTVCVRVKATLSFGQASKRASVAAVGEWTYAKHPTAALPARRVVQVRLTHSENVPAEQRPSREPVLVLIVDDLPTDEELFLLQASLIQRIEHVVQSVNRTVAAGKPEILRSDETGTANASTAAAAAAAAARPTAIDDNAACIVVATTNKSIVARTVDASTDASHVGSLFADSSLSDELQYRSPYDLDSDSSDDNMYIDHNSAFYTYVDGVSMQPHAQTRQESETQQRIRSASLPGDRGRTTPASALNPSAHTTRLTSLNARFQRICDERVTMRGNSVSFSSKNQLNEELLALAMDFEGLVLLYGRVICTEWHLPNELKSIRPSSLGGVAGGEKFIVQGILFKFCTDECNLYGSLDSAAKVAGHDLRALAYIHNHALRGGASGEIRVPMAAILDCRGVRLVAVTLLPISGSDSLIYGSEDAGKVVAAGNSDGELYDSGIATVDLAASIGKFLNLRPHVAGRIETALMHLCVDIEIHRGSDGRRYMIDFARVFPPQSPNPAIKASHLVRVFRPEFCQRYPVPLCSDGFSRFLVAGGEEIAAQMNADLHGATRSLLQVNVFEAAASAHQLLEIWLDAKLGATNFAKTMLVATLHAEGVNLRLLGRVGQAAGSLRCRAVQILCAVESLARVLKNRLRRRLRAADASGGLEATGSFLRIIVASFLNATFGAQVEIINREQPGGIHLRTELLTGVDPSPEADLSTRLMESHEILNMVSTLTQECVLAFSWDLKEFDMSSLISNLLDPAQGLTGDSYATKSCRGIHVSFRHLLVRRTLFLAGVKLDKRALNSACGWAVIRPEDVLSAGERLKPMGIVDHALAYTLKMRAWGTAAAHPQRQSFLLQRPRILKDAMRALGDALCRDPTSIVTFRNIAQLLLVHDVFAETCFEARVLLRTLPLRMMQQSFLVANKFLTLSLKSDPQNSESLFQMGLLWSAAGDPGQALEYILKATESAPNVLERAFQTAEELNRLASGKRISRACAPTLMPLSHDNAALLCQRLRDALAG